MDFQKEAHRIYAEDKGGRLIAEITFHERKKGVFVIDHTFVDSSLRGRGVAGKLVEQAVEQIKAQGGTVTATCSYAVSWLRNKQDKHKAPFA